jgi:hypothetical protein
VAPLRDEGLSLMPGELGPAAVLTELDPVALACVPAGFLVESRPRGRRSRQTGLSLRAPFGSIWPADTDLSLTGSDSACVLAGMVAEGLSLSNESV